MRSLTISPLLSLPLLFRKVSMPIPVFNGQVKQEKEISPVENEEIFDHLFVHNDRKFDRSANLGFTATFSSNF